MRAAVGILYLVVLLLGAAEARAGMASPLPTDIARALRLNDAAHIRLEAISFFLITLLASALVVRWLWNGLARDFPRLPRLTYGKSLTVVVLWGLMFLIVLAMIATAREMMTPGVWQKTELLYRLPERPPVERADSERTAERRDQLRRLQAELWHFAAGHDGQFPASLEALEVEPAVWEMPGCPGLSYLYLPGRSVKGPAAILVYEPDVYSDGRMVLRTNGEIVLVPAAGLREPLTTEQPR